MQKAQRKKKDEDAKKVAVLVAKLNQYRNEYYNKAEPGVSDAVYDHLFDELQTLEKKTGIILGSSPTQTVGYAPASSLKKVRHPVPLLSLDKTKQMGELQQMAGKGQALLMLKLDGLTIKLVYEKGQLVEASTRGDGDIGEVVTHNIPAFYNVPMRIPHKRRLVITGEGFIHWSGISTETCRSLRRQRWNVPTSHPSRISGRQCAGTSGSGSVITEI